MPEKRIFAKAGHVCMMCGFKATTKNKYRELQDHLVRRHFQDRIKAALPTRRPFMCPDHSCNVEGKDWQALMRHYTGKHGVLEAYLKEFLASQMEYKENLQFKGSLPPTNKIGCRRKRHKRHSSGSGDQDPTEAEDSTEDPPVTPILPGINGVMTSMESIASSTSVPTVTSAIHSFSSAASEAAMTCTTICGNGISEESQQQQFHNSTTTTTATSNGCSSSVDSQTILQLDDSDPADCPPTHLALVLKRRKINKESGLEEEPEETVAFVDLKYFQPLSANQYVMKSQVIDPSLLALQSPLLQQPQHIHHHQHQPQQQSQLPQPMGASPPLPAYLQSAANGGTAGCYFVDSGGQSYFESFPVQQPAAVEAASVSANDSHHYVGVTSGTVTSSASPASPNSAASSAIYIPADAFATNAAGSRPHEAVVTATTCGQLHHHSTTTHHAHYQECFDQVVPNPAEAVSSCAGEVEVSTTLVQYEDEGQPPILMEVPISNGTVGSVATVSIDPKGLNGRGCSKVVVETVKSIPMDAGGCVTAATSESNVVGGNYELMTHDMNGMKEIDFAMF